MSADTDPTGARELWQADRPDAPGLSAAELRHRVERLARTARVRNYGGLIVCGFVLAVCVWWFVDIDEPLARVGAVLTAVAVGLMAWQIGSNQWGEQAAARRAALMGATAWMDFHRGELERQRDFHRGRRLWTRLLVLLPSALVFLAGFAKAHPEVARTIWLEALVVVLLAAAAVPLNLRLARRYQRQLDELDRSYKEQP
jgi:peptidoglycan/LPS O-acetylase OafA/YrhL